MQRASVDSVSKTLTIPDLLPSRSEPQNCWSIESLGSSLILPVHSYRCTLTSVEKSNLCQLYCKLYSILPPSNVDMLSLLTQYSHIILFIRNTQEPKCIFFNCNGYLGSGFTWGMFWLLQSIIFVNILFSSMV